MINFLTSPVDAHLYSFSSKMSWSVISGSSSISSQVSITWWRQVTVECFHRWHKIRSIRHYETAGAVSRSFWFFFSCDQAALWMVFSVRLSVCHTFLAATKQLYEWYFLSVCLSVCPSHLFDYVPIIASSWNFQELSPRTRVTSMQKVKVIGQRSRSQRSRPKFSFPDCNSSLNSHMMMKWYI